MSSQANPNPQHEPTMEEILASIRKIISEDQPVEGAKPGARPQAVRPQPQSEPPARPPVPRPELDVLDLTDEVQEDEPAPIPVARPSPPPPSIRPPAPIIENDVIFQNIDPANTRDRSFSSQRAPASLNGQEPSVSTKSGSIEAIFAEAVQKAFRPALKEWIDDHSDDVTERLRPLIQAWMDEHLPALIEAAVVREISRAFARKREP
jgi:cell pole-organizing protein PopZ